MDNIKCKVCGKEYSGKFCPDCGTPSFVTGDQITAPSYTPRQLTYEDLVPSVYAFTDRAREKQTLNCPEDVKFNIDEEGNLLLRIISRTCVEEYVGTLNRERPCDVGFRRKDGGPIGSGTACQPAFGAHIMEVEEKLIRIYSPVLPPPIMFQGFDYHLEKVDNKSEV